MRDYIVLMEGALRGGDGEHVAHLWEASRRDRCGMHTRTKCGLAFHNLFDDLDEYARVEDAGDRPLCEACEATVPYVPPVGITPHPELPYKHGEILDRYRDAGWQPNA